MKVGGGGAEDSDVVRDPYFRLGCLEVLHTFKGYHVEVESHCFSRLPEPSLYRRWLETWGYANTGYC